jgi:hypothetical protein
MRAGQGATRSAEKPRSLATKAAGGSGDLAGKVAMSTNTAPLGPAADRSTAIVTPVATLVHWSPSRQGARVDRPLDCRKHRALSSSDFVVRRDTIWLRRTPVVSTEAHRRRRTPAALRARCRLSFTRPASRSRCRGPPGGDRQTSCPRSCDWSPRPARRTHKASSKSASPC